VARLRVESQDYEQAIDALDLALKEQLGPDDDKLRATLVQNRVSALRLAAFTVAKRGDYRRGLSFIERIEETTPDATEVSKDRLRVIHLVGNKRLDDRDYRGAAEVYREGVRRFPRDETSRHNLVAVLERLAMPMVEAGRCTKAEEVLQEIRVVDADSTFPSRAQTRCLMERARARLEAKDYPEAVELIRAARKANPNEPAVVQNLAVALLRWASDLSGRGRCREARRLVKEITTLRVSDIRGPEVRRALGGCGS
jgi:tetratricopeptide (TPR) repeat protein